MPIKLYKKIQQWIDTWKLKVNYQKTEVVSFHGQLLPPTMNTIPIRISQSSTVLGVKIDQNLTFNDQYAISMRTIEQRLNMLKPYIYGGLSCETARKILTHAILPKALYAAALWDTASRVSITQCITFILGAHFNPPGEALHKIINIPPITLLYSKERLSIMRGLAKYGYTNIISSTHKSTISKNFLSDLKKVVDRRTQVNDIQPEDLSKRIVDKAIQSHWTKRWKTQVQQGICPYGLLSQLPTTHLVDYPVPLELDRKSLGPLCDLLTGHSRLQLFQYRIQQSYTPTCACLQDDETPEHYLHHCADYAFIRETTNPTLDQWKNIIHYNMLTRRLSF